MALEKNILGKLDRYCAYQMRCSFDVRRFLTKHQVPEIDQDAYIVFLESINILNDRRFALQFAYDHLKNKHWGIRKIKMALLQKQLDAESVEAALQSLHQEEITQMIHKLIEKKRLSLAHLPLLEQKDKIARFLMQKGFSWNDIFEGLQTMEGNKFIDEDW